MAEKKIALSALLDLIRPGMRVFIHAGPAESLVLRDALRARPDRAKGVEFFGIFIPGVNQFDYADLHDEARAASSFVPPVSRRSFEMGRFEFSPVHYSELGPYVRSRAIDLAILHCPPLPAGALAYEAYSLGVNADVGIVAARHATQCAVILNPSLPLTHVAEPLRAVDIDLLVDGDGPILSNPSEATDEMSDRIGAHVAALVHDGDTMQMGIGRLPAAILRKLGNHRKLKMHTGMITDEVADLVRLGVIDTSVKTPIRAGMAIGTETIRGLALEPICRFHSTDFTHDVRQIATIPSFVSINSAVEVDLFGQVNGEIINGKQMSGIGGSSDFTRGARLSPGGRAIIALPASARGKSRIVAQLSGPASQSRADADHVVTEFGAAFLRHRPIDARAEALIAIADPAHRDGLAQAWREMRANL